MSKLLGVEKPFQVDGLVTALNGARERDAHNRVVRNYNELRDQYDLQTLIRNLYEAGEAARLAQFELLKSQVPDAPCLKLTSQKYKNGEAKTVARLHYEEVFRREAKRLGVPDSEINRKLGY